MKLVDYAQSRDNNFNLIRIIAALSVLVSHSFVLATGNPNAVPLRASIGMTLGTFAVDAFFIVSGFLVTASLVNRQNIIDFVWARVLRIYPALLVMVLLTVFALGPYFTSEALSAYLVDHKTYQYLTKCSTLISGVT